MDFDRLAPHYDWMEKLAAGTRLQRMRTCWLEKLAGCRTILSAGEGHGRFAAACAARFPQAEITCLDSSEAMLARAKARPELRSSRVKWIEADLLNWTPEAKYDAIATCFFLDCFPPDILSEVIARLTRCATPGAVWLVVDFAIPATGPARWRARFVHALMYGFFRAAVQLPAKRLVAPGPFLQAHGFRRTEWVEAEWGLLRAEVWRMA